MSHRVTQLNKVHTFSHDILHYLDRKSRRDAIEPLSGKKTISVTSITVLVMKITSVFVTVYMGGREGASYGQLLR